MFRTIFALLLVFGVLSVIVGAQVRNPRVPRVDRQVQRQQNRNLRNYGRTAFDRLDVNNDGYISRFEWRGSLRGFDRIDRNNDGRISRYEWRTRNRRRR